MILKAVQILAIPIILTILISIKERACLMYEGKSKKLREEQWEGWKGFVRDWCKRKNFRELLPQVKEQFDKKFVKELDKILEEVQAEEAKNRN